MDSAKVVVGKPESHGCPVILDLFREGIGQARETANAHPHGKILALYEACADMLGIRVFQTDPLPTYSSTCRLACPSV